MSGCVGAVAVDAPGLTYVVGRQSCDDRAYGDALDQGNCAFAGQESTVLFEDVRAPERTHCARNAEKHSLRNRTTRKNIV